MLGSWNLAPKYTHYLVSEHVTFSTKALLIFAEVSISLQKIAFFGNNKTFIQSNIVRDVVEIFNSVFSFCKIKGYS